MPTFPTRIVQPVSGDMRDPRANHSVRPASGHPVRNEPVIEGGPPAIPWTHADQVNTALLGFIRS